ncbi:hypothetical protein IMCC9480_3440 [Oxalobacteraceae bacterium IMCC9480]|nr:hypothetical protein IMCC9480_3440 [Oxalobacteraceae bacterium IMCC9480]NDP59125.1 hypothetical protein [Oxalobacteraceae bacterium]
MSDLRQPNLEYFETDQVKFAVHLWKANKKAGGADFDVLKFVQQWAYADAVLGQALLSEDEAVSGSALQLTQLRVLFMARYPARALTCGAIVDAAPAQTTPDPAAPKRSYLKGIR